MPEISNNELTCRLFPGGPGNLRCFRLQTEGPHCWYHRCCPRSLPADTRTLVRLLNP
ncbi:hypothetical protein GRY44_004760 [Salmonella enterica]|nr:hypothetical protein [Salmonella enterica subsp. enterica serovar Oranienburg]EEE0365679.1 hypothetical protein [Salmonella enterica subsp. enterica serovar Oranienburg]EEI4451306.1 hypothetical protein [Salmonella enterica]EEJ0431184.1 hypothetical protein [Salmonella enterica]HAF4830398.1 hypothetical protein [Salmonella enterica]